jgi:hypothetical protein
MAKAAHVDTAPAPKVYIERIGGRDWELVEKQLDILSEVNLWPDNPRLKVAPFLPPHPTEADLEAALADTSGYDNLKTSIETLGQMEPVYVWRRDEDKTYLTFEGATRICILRDLARKHTSGPKEGKFRYVRAKILPPDFGEIERVILLARIHVRGSGVREWGRYIEAQFIHEAVTGRNGNPPVMNMTEMAQHMGKSLSWVNRLKDAYQFAMAFVDHVDADDAKYMAAKKFSTLEEISKVAVIGPQLRDTKNKNYDGLRADVFDMVKNDAFKEYREARFLKEFYEDPEKWEQLKSGEKHVASKLMLEVQTKSSSVRTKIAGLEGQIQRSVERQDVTFSDDDIVALERAITRINEQVHQGVRPFRVQLKRMTRALSEASMADVKVLTKEELDELREGLSYFDGLVEKHWKPA